MCTITYRHQPVRCLNRKPRRSSGLKLFLAAVVSIRNSTAYASKASKQGSSRRGARYPTFSSHVKVKPGKHQVVSGLNTFGTSSGLGTKGPQFADWCYALISPRICTTYLSFSHNSLCLQLSLYFLVCIRHTRSLVSPVRKILAFTDRRHLPSRLSPRSLVSAILRVRQHHPSLPPCLKRQVFLRSLDSADEDRCKQMSYYPFPCPATSS